MCVSMHVCVCRFLCVCFCVVCICVRVCACVCGERGACVCACVLPCIKLRHAESASMSAGKFAVASGQYCHFVP